MFASEKGRAWHVPTDVFVVLTASRKAQLYNCVISFRCGAAALVPARFASSATVAGSSGSFMNRLSTITASTLAAPIMRCGVRSNPNGVKPVLLTPSRWPFRHLPRGFELDEDLASPPRRRRGERLPVPRPSAPLDLFPAVTGSRPVVERVDVVIGVRRRDDRPAESSKFGACAPARSSFVKRQSGLKLRMLRSAAAAFAPRNRNGSRKTS